MGVAANAHAATTLPNGFVEEEVVRVGSPTGFAFTPDKKLFVAQKSGLLWYSKLDGSGNRLLALDLRDVICADGERGLIGITVDPDYSSNHYIYLNYTRKRIDCGFNAITGGATRISRFTVTGNTVDPASEVPLITAIPSAGNWHLGGDLEFGKDKLLYATTGDGNSPTTARQLHNLNGKILRIRRDGTIPGDNPYASGSRCNLKPAAAGARCAEIYAYGLRNPWRFAFDPNSTATRFFINDVGANRWEEINLGKKGADYGWNVREGHCTFGSYTDCPPPPASMTDPIYDYPHTSGCTSIVGGSFVPAGRWPAPYDSSYLFSDYTCGKMWRLVPKAGGGYTTSEFATGDATAAVHLEWGPMPLEGEALYYASFPDGGHVKRIRYVGSVNRAPTADFSLSPESGPLPLAVHFDGSRSSDPDGDAISYDWNFGDGSPPVTTSSPTTDHTYTVAGTYEATLTVRDDEGATSQPVKLKVFAGNTPPEVEITSPAPTYRFAVGDTIKLGATARDGEEGTLPSSAITWEVLRHHVVGTSTATAHTHPWYGPAAGATPTITAPAAEDLASTFGSYLELRVTATDSKGLSATVSRRLDPRKTEIQFDTKPQGATMTAGGVRFVTPKNFTSWVKHTIFASPPAEFTSVGAGGLKMKNTFSKWEDGFTGRERSIVTPTSPSYWRAMYSSVPAP